jgi:20S proteasome alpha/beta subunit
MLSAPPAPRIPRQIPRRHKSVRMTIAAGFNCIDGILLASDTLYSGVNKQHARKIWTVFGETGPTTVAIAGAGGAVLIGRARDEISERLAILKEPPNHIHVREAVEGVLYSVLHKSKPRRQSDDQFPLSFLVAVRTPDSCTLYQSAGDAVIARVDEAATCIGWGASIGLYVTGHLYQHQMPARWAYIVAAHLIRLAKKYAADCDGDTHLLLIPIVGDPVFTSDAAEIKRMEAHLEKLDDVLRVVLPGGAFEASDFTLKHRLGELVKAIENVRNVQAAVGIAAGSSTMEGHAATVKQEPTPTKKREEG